MFSKRAVATLLGGLMAVSVSAVWAGKGFNYSYADVGYERTEVDTGDTLIDEADVDSIKVDGSFGAFDLLALRAGFQRGRSQIKSDALAINETVDITEFYAGMQGHYELIKKLDGYAEFLYYNSKVNDSDTPTHTDLGWIYEAGLRYQVAKKLELKGAYRYESGDIDEGFAVASVIFDITKNLGINVNASVGDDDDEVYFAGVRINF